MAHPQEKTVMGPIVPPLATRSRGILTVIGGADGGRVLSLPPGEIATLGRGEACTHRFDDASVSGQHARIMVIDGSFVFQDDGSTNGSYVNDALSRQAVALRDGDRLRLGTSTLVRFSLVDEQEEKALKQVYEAALLDALTGALNRRALEERIEADLAAANKHGLELSLLMFDIDHFKKVNDTFGHLAGDAVIRAIADLARRSVRAGDTLGRYGGEEFVVILRGIGLSGGVEIAERLRAAVAQHPVAFEGRQIPVTASGGVASLACCGAARNRTQLLSVADARLYKAKQGGRNRIMWV
jgi:two-component system, cell cycle response regulator